MAKPDLFALANSGLAPFLHAEVGTQVNGSALTMLSVLARLGFDPWVEAAGWALLPRGTTIDRLAGLIGQMPLCPQSLREARATAARLVRLLPGQAPIPVYTGKKSALPVIALVAGICLALALAFIMQGFSPHGPSITPDIHQPTGPKG